MATITKKERVRAALAGQPVDHVPVSLWGHDFQREARPRDLVAATLDSYRAGDWDFIKLNPRATYFAEAWGNRYGPPSGQQHPRLLDVLIKDADGFDAIEPADARGGVFGDHLYALRLVLDEVGAEADVLHTVFSPLAVLAQLCGPGTEFTALAAANPAGAHAALRAIAATLARYCRAAIELGAAGIFYAPLTWASHDTASEELYREFGRPYDLQVLSGVRVAPFNVLHVCHDRNMIDLLLDYPVAAFNWADAGVGNPSLTDVRAKTTKAVIGGFDHARFHELAPGEIEAQARAAVAAGSARILLGGGCAIRPATSDAARAAAGAAARALR